MAQRNVASYLEKSFYNKIVVGEENIYEFSDGPLVKYRPVTFDGAKASFIVATTYGQFDLVTPLRIMEHAKTPMLVKLRVDPKATTPFTLLRAALEEKIGGQLDSTFQDTAYLNTDRDTFNQLRALNVDGAKLIFTVTVRHIHMRAGLPRIKYVLSAVDKQHVAKKRKIKEETKKTKAPLISENMAEFVVPNEELTEQVMAQSFGDLGGFRSLE